MLLCNKNRCRDYGGKVWALTWYNSSKNVFFYDNFVAYLPCYVGTTTFNQRQRPIWMFIWPVFTNKTDNPRVFNTSKSSASILIGRKFPLKNYIAHYTSSPLLEINVNKLLFLVLVVNSFENEILRWWMVWKIFDSP